MNKKIQDTVEAMQLLEDSERRFRALVTATSDVIYRMSPDWTVMRELDGRGFLSDTSEPNKDWISKYVHPTDHLLVLATISEAIRTKKIFQLEHRVLKTDGTPGWTFSRAVPILNEQNEITEWFGTASDITARKKIEEDLRITREQLIRSKGLYEAVVGSTPDLIYIFDLNYKFIYANKALLTMWGKTEDEYYGCGLLELGYEPWHAEMHEREIDQVIATGKNIRGEVSFPHATLGKRMYDYIFAPVLDEKGVVQAVAGTTRDISELKLAEDSLKQSEDQFRTLTQSLPQLIWTASPDGYCDFFNQKWIEYTGSSAPDSAGDGWTKYIHPQYITDVYRKWQDALTTGISVIAEFPLRSKDGGYSWFYVVGNPIKDDTGTIRKWVGALTNIESRKAVEESLEQLVTDRTRELQRSNDDLQQFAHVASHDLKEPVRKVKIFASRLEKEFGNTMSDTASVYLKKIYSATDRMNNMIDGVLNYSTVNNLEQDFGNVNLTDILRNIESDLEVLIQQKGANIKYDQLSPFEGAPVLIYQLFYNLINNSLKFARKDASPLITISSREIQENNYPLTEITLSDNGIGFSQEHAERIFNTFTRLNAKDQYEGTGLGLALCKKIVERHGGSIRAQGEEGSGSSFIISLPVKHTQH
ncbi:MAG TPA: PAS domain S-box protein [Pseudobacter sp.]|nr:PAS domain S-box protein [Pseudobacter sp.]